MNIRYGWHSLMLLFFSIALTASADDVALERRVADLEAALAQGPGLVEQLRGRDILISGAAAAAFFSGDSQSDFSDDPFRIDEARLFIDARLLANTFFFGELNLYERESNNEDLRAGEVYLEVEDPLQRLIGEGRLSLRFGRFDIPFGEEYLTRDPIDNPLVSHSLADFWGVDEGLEAFGSLGQLDYVLAIQNGGHPSLGDGNSDKSITARLGTPITSGIRASISAMRTGDLDPDSDRTSEIWFGNNFVVPLSNEDETVKVFHAEFIEVNLQANWDSGFLAFALGQGRQETELEERTDRREAAFSSITLSQDLVGPSYAAARYSRIDSDEGWPVVGQGNFGALWRGQQPVSEISRISVGLGYRWSPELVTKLEYSIEEGETPDRLSVQNRNLLSLQATLIF